ncbi:MAG: hypothetical protein KDK90_28700, partial [Leptospiraceae bacterium]|nr:hypothetical protein [Leptospiraceae bacterium]
MKKFIIILICFLQMQNIQSDSVKNITEGCNPDIKDRGENTFLTFYGDSLGDLVDLPTHGLVGWDAYLGFFRPDFDPLGWRIQNFAVIGWTTRSIYNALKECLKSKEARKEFKMSNTIAMEIGGNDMVNYTPLLIFMPWKYWTYRDPTTNKDVKGVVDVVIYNIKVLIYFFRHPLIDKNVLVMGNFPSLSYSPTLGHVGDYFSAFQHMTDIFYQKWTETVPPLNIQRDDQFENAQIQKELTIDIWKKLLEIIGSPANLIEDLFGPQFTTKFVHFLEEVIPKKEKIPDAIEPFQTNAPDWYFKWVYHTYRNPTTAISFGLYLMQPGLESLAMDLREKTRNWDRTFTYKEDNTQTYTAQNRKGGDYVHFLPLYHTLVRKYDCSAYLYCWVGQPMYYRDATP